MIDSNCLERLARVLADARTVAECLARRRKVPWRELRVTVEVGPELSLLLIVPRHGTLPLGETLGDARVLVLHRGEDAPLAGPATIPFAG